MEAIILAGGLGTRLRKVLPDLPKPMAPIQGRPFLEFVLTHLSIIGFQHVILSLGYRAEKIMDYFGENFQEMKLSYVVETKPLGTGGGLRLAVQKSINNHTYVLNGDTFLNADFNRIEKTWQSFKCTTVIVRKASDTSRYGAVNIADGKIRGFVEKGIANSEYMNAGCYILPRGAIDKFSVGQPFSFEADYLTKEASQGGLDYCVESGYFIDIGIPDDYLRAQIELPKLFSTYLTP